ncbi:MAG: DUF6262 family protein [Proteiniphilum sp.]|jgi:histidyl-tRNA synthetase|nr:DUF6262 family protein [Proteiniphilum sp.]HCA30687.1 hypothetical protein [Oscillospiraceae bacterium]
MSKQPKQLLQKQEMQRQKTVNLIIRAISELKVEGYSIKINHLMEMTGLSRSVFSKPHVREILQNNGIGYAKTNMQIQTPAKLQSKKQSQITNLKEKLAQKDAYISNLTAENVALKSECELLRGRLFLLMQRLQTDGKT